MKVSHHEIVDRLNSGLCFDFRDPLTSTHRVQEIISFKIAPALPTFASLPMLMTRSRDDLVVSQVDA